MPTATSMQHKISKKDFDRLEIDIFPKDVEAYLKSELPNRIMFLDGAMGTMIQKLRLEEMDFRGRLLISLIYLGYKYFRGNF